MMISAIRSLLLMTAVALAAILFHAPPARAAPMEVSAGTVTAVGAYAVTVADPRDTKPRIFALNQLRTKVTRDGNPARFSDLRPGDGVTIWFRPIGDKLHAERIRAVSPPLLPVAPP